MSMVEDRASGSLLELRKKKENSKVTRKIKCSQMCERIEVE
jgi:hypothetical protein